MENMNITSLICPHCKSEIPYGAKVCRGCQAEIQYGTPFWALMVVFFSGIFIGLIVSSIVNDLIGIKILSSIVWALITLLSWYKLWTYVNKYFKDRVIFERMYRKK